jgi:hypothetical protein
VSVLNVNLSVHTQTRHTKAEQSGGCTILRTTERRKAKSSLTKQRARCAPKTISKRVWNDRGKGIRVLALTAAPLTSSSGSEPQLSSLSSSLTTGLLEPSDVAWMSAGGGTGVGVGGISTGGSGVGSGKSGAVGFGNSQLDDWCRGISLQKAPSQQR